MSPQKNKTITRQEQKQLTEGEISSWTLGSPNVSIATNIDTWQKNTDQRRKNVKLGNVSNTRKKDILPRTIKEHSR